MAALEQGYQENRREQLAEQGIERDNEHQDDDIETDEEILNKHHRDLLDVFKESIDQFTHATKGKGSKAAKKS